MNMHKSDHKAENNNTERYSLLPSFPPFIEPFSVENEVSQRERKPRLTYISNAIFSQRERTPWLTSISNAIFYKGKTLTHQLVMQSFHKGKENPNSHPSIMRSFHQGKEGPDAHPSVMWSFHKGKESTDSHPTVMSLCECFQFEIKSYTTFIPLMKISDGIDLIH